MQEVKVCYENSLKQNPDLEGTVIVDFKIDDTGSVKNTKANTSKSSLKDEKVHRCITEKMSTWKFPAAPKGQVAVISYPFRFQKASK